MEMLCLSVDPFCLRSSAGVVSEFALGLFRTSTRSGEESGGLFSTCQVYFLDCLGQLNANWGGNCTLAGTSG